MRTDIIEYFTNLVKGTQTAPANDIAREALTAICELEAENATLQGMQTGLKLDGGLLKIAVEQLSATLKTADACIVTRDADNTALQAEINALKDWRQPTPENVNALPAGIRDYIHSLSTLCDPAGMVAENTLLKDQIALADAKIKALILKEGHTVADTLKSRIPPIDTQEPTS